MSIRRNTGYNLLGALIPLAVSLVTIPIYLGLVGEARYGVLVIMWLLLGYFGLFDLGLGRATAQRIAVLAGGRDADRTRVFWTALVLNLGIGMVGGLLLWPLASYFFGNLFKVEEALRPEVQTAIPLLILAVPVATLSGVLSGALQAREKFLELNLISVCGTALFQLLPLAAAMFWTVDLVTLLSAALLARLLTLGWLFERCGRYIFAGYAPVFSSLEAGSLLRFGGWVTVSSLVGPIMVLLDRFVIGAAAGAKAVTHYTVPFQLGDRTTIISTALSAALFPRLAGAAPNEQRRLALDGQRVIAVVLTPLMSGAMLLIGPFLGWWIDPVFAGKSAFLGQLLLLAFWFNSFAKIPYAQLQARGRADLVARCHLMEVLPYLGLLYVGLNTLGLAGAAIAFVLRIFMDFVLLAWFAGTLKASLRILLGPSMLILAALFVAMGSTSGEAAWMVMAICQLIVSVLWAWRQSPPGIREPVAAIFKPLANRLVRS